MDTNLLNYYNESIKENVEVIGYLYDLSEEITFKRNTRTEEDVGFYCLKLFAVRKNNKWILTNGFIRVAIKPLPIGSFVRLKGVLSKATKLEDTNCLNLVKFRKKDEDWIIEPIKPQKVYEDKLPIYLTIYYNLFKKVPILYNTGEDINYSILPKDIPSRLPVAETSYINESTYISVLGEDEKVAFQPYIPNIIKPTFLYNRLIRELFTLDNFIIDSISLNTYMLDVFEPHLRLVGALKGYSTKPSKTNNFYLETSKYKLKNIPYIKLLQPRITIY